MKSTIEYWAEVGRRSLKEAANLYGTNFKKLIVTGVLTAIAVYFLYQTEGWPAAFAKLEWWLMLLAAEFAIVLIAFLPFFLLTPHRMHKECQDELAAANAMLESKEAEAKSEIAIARAEAERITNSDPRKNVIRSEFQARLDGFKRLESALRSRSTPAVESFYNHDWETSEYVKQHVAGFTHYGRNSPPVNSHTRKMNYSNQEFDDFAARCQDRIATLGELIEMHS